MPTAAPGVVGSPSSLLLLHHPHPLPSSLLRFIPGRSPGLLEPTALGKGAGKAHSRWEERGMPPADSAPPPSLHPHFISPPSQERLGSPKAAEWGCPSPRASLAQVGAGADPNASTLDSFGNSKRKTWHWKRGGSPHELCPPRRLHLMFWGAFGAFWGFSSLTVWGWCLRSPLPPAWLGGGPQTGPFAAPPLLGGTPRALGGGKKRPWSAPLHLPAPFWGSPTSCAPPPEVQRPWTWPCQLGGALVMPHRSPPLAPLILGPSCIALGGPGWGFGGGSGLASE